MIPFSNVIVISGMNRSGTSWFTRLFNFYENVFAIDDPKITTLKNSYKFDIKRQIEDWFKLFEECCETGKSPHNVKISPKIIKEKLKNELTFKGYFNKPPPKNPSDIIFVVKQPYPILEKIKGIYEDSPELKYWLMFRCPLDALVKPSHRPASLNDWKICMEDAANLIEEDKVGILRYHEVVKNPQMYIDNVLKNLDTGSQLFKIEKSHIKYGRESLTEDEFKILTEASQEISIRLNIWY